MSRSIDDAFEVIPLRRLVAAVVATAVLSSLVVLLACETTSAQEAQRVLPAESPGLPSSVVLPYADDDISALSSSGSTLYAAGWFKKLGHPLGHLAVVGRRSPRVLGGPVTAVAPDGGGGWFLGGNFLTVGGVQCPRLAHLRADGKLDRRWCVAPDSWVWELTLTRSRLYVGGEFGFIAGRPRSSAAAFERATAKLLPWHPRFRTSGCGGLEEGAPGGALIDKIAATRSTVFVGGCFHLVGGRERYRLAAVDAASGKPKPWRPRFADVHGSWALAPAGDRLFVVGEWLEPSDESLHDEVVRERLAAVDPRTGAVKKWYPTPSGDFFIEVSGSTIYLGGEFNRIGGIRRRNLAAIDSATGAVSAWRPDPDGSVDLVVPTRRRIYVHGEFKRVSGSPRDGLAAVDRRRGAATPWKPTLRGAVVDIGVSGKGRVAMGLWKSRVLGFARSGLAAIDTANGRLTTWKPRIKGGPVKGVAVADETVFIAGDFTRVGAQKRNGLATIDRRSGRTLPWNPKTSGGWNVITVVNGVAYVVREYDAAEKDTHRLSAIDARSGRTIWNRPLRETPEEPRPLAVVGSTVFVAEGWDFRNGLSVVDAATGRTKRVAVKTAGYVNALAATPDLLYVATWSEGAVTAVDVSSGEERWRAEIDAGVETMTVDQNVLYLGGNFDHINGQKRMHLAALDAQTGELKPWSAEIEDITALHVAGSRLYVSGAFDGHLASVPLGGP